MSSKSASCVWELSRILVGGTGRDIPEVSRPVPWNSNNRTSHVSYMYFVLVYGAACVYSCVFIMTDRSTVNVQIGPQTRLTLGSGANSVIGSQLNFPQSPHVPRQVIVTPISAAHTVTHTPSPPLISKVLIKVVKRDGKKAEGKTFTLRNLDPTKIKTRDNLKTLIRAQLQGDIRSGDFDVGYLQNSSVVSLRSREDIQEVMSNAAKGTKVTLWCDGLQSISAVGNKAKKRKQQDDASSDESDSEPRKKSKVEEKDDKIQKTFMPSLTRHIHQCNIVYGVKW